jgi:hypothetical protein
VPAEARDAALLRRLELANASLDARNYRAALAYAAEVLAIDPRHTGAMKIRADARAMLARFDSQLAEARDLLAAGDVQRAARALEGARAIDATSPSVSELSARLAERVRQQEVGAAAVPKPRAPAGVTPPRPGAEPSREPARQTTRETTPPEPGPGDRPLPAPSGPQHGGAPPTPPRIEAPPDVPAPLPPKPAEGAPETPAVGSSPPEAPPATAGAASPAAAPRPEPPPQAPSPEEDETAIRRVIASYARAIEDKDLVLFRAIKPNLSREEERRLQEGFRAVTSQQVSLAILSIDVKGQQAAVALKRRDTIQAGGRQQTAESRQTMTLARTGAGWVIADIR